MTQDDRKNLHIIVSYSKQSEPIVAVSTEVSSKVYKHLIFSSAYEKKTNTHKFTNEARNHKASLRHPPFAPYMDNVADAISQSS